MTRQCRAKKRGLCLAFYVGRSGSGAVGALPAKTTEQAHRVRKRRSLRSRPSRPSSARRRSQRAESAPGTPTIGLDESRALPDLSDLAGFDFPRTAVNEALVRQPSNDSLFGALQMR